MSAFLVLIAPLISSPAWEPHFTAFTQVMSLGGAPLLFRLGKKSRTKLVNLSRAYPLCFANHKPNVSN
jgi:hypothetical protein